MAICIVCGKELASDDIGATRKLINRASTEFLCIPCLAKRFHIPEALLRSKIEEWRSYGCMLFPQKDESKQSPR